MAVLTDLTGLPLSILLPLSPVYGIGCYLFVEKAKKSFSKKQFRQVIAMSLVIFVAFATPVTVILAALPNWTLTLTTDKATYAVGAKVTITVTLTNYAYFAKSLTTTTGYPAVLEVAVTKGSAPRQSVFMVDYINLFNSFGPQQSFQRVLTWQAINGTGEFNVHATISSLFQRSLYNQVNVTVIP